MMIGSNTLVLNEATVKAALQMYLDDQRNRDAPEVKVVAVEPLPGPVFRVQLQSEEGASE